MKGEPSGGVLVVDADPDIRRSIREWFTTWRSGLAVWTVQDVDHALPILADKTVDLAVVDVYPENEAGAEMIRRLRQHEPRLPVIAMTTFPDPEALRTGPSLAGIPILGKPFNVGLLEEAVGRFLGRGNRGANPQ